MDLNYQEADLQSCQRDVYNVAALEMCCSVVNNLADATTAGANVLLVGQLGTGKTYLGWALARAIVRGPWLAGGNDPERTWGEQLGNALKPINQVLIVPWKEWLDRVKASWNKGARERSSVELFDVEWLVLDDIGVPDTFTEWAQGQLWSVINYRSSKRRPTVVTTNLPVQKGQEMGLDPRIVERLTETDRCWREVLLGPSRRQVG